MRLGEPETDQIDPQPPEKPVYPYLGRFKNWGKGPFNWTCNGKRVRKICIFGVGDLVRLTHRRELFANKFHTNFQPQTYQCLEEWLHDRTERERVHGVNTDDQEFYRNLNMVRHHIDGAVRIRR